MTGKERLALLKRYIQDTERVSVTELSNNYGVTEETIRRDLDKLESEGLVTRIHGGAIWNVEAQKDGIHFYRRQSKNLLAKRRIALKTSEIIKGKNTIIADSSSTVVEALKTIADNPDIVVVTNSSEVFQEFQQSELNIISTGGIFNKKSLSFQGELTKSNIMQYNVKLALISCKGLDIEKGVLDSYESEAEIKKTMLGQAEEVALLADHTKFNHTAFLHLMDLKKVNYLVTDVKPADKWVEYCSANGIQLIY